MGNGDRRQERIAWGCRYLRGIGGKGGFVEIKDEGTALGKLSAVKKFAELK